VLLDVEAHLFIRFLDQAGDVVLPAREFVAELAASFGRERVVLGATIVGGGVPFGVDGAGVLEPVERSRRAAVKGTSMLRQGRLTRFVAWIHRPGLRTV